MPCPRRSRRWARWAMKWIAAYAGQRRPRLTGGRTASSCSTLRRPACPGRSSTRRGSPPSGLRRRACSLRDSWPGTRRLARHPRLRRPGARAPQCIRCGVSAAPGPGARPSPRALPGAGPRWSRSSRSPSEPVDTVREVVEGMDLVVTAGAIHSTPHGAVQAGWLAPGAFASLVDYDSAWSPAALRELDLLCTDDTAQLQRARDGGRFQELPALHADLAELVRKTEGRTNVPWPAAPRPATWVWRSEMSPWQRRCTGSLGARLGLAQPTARDRGRGRGGSTRQRGRRCPGRTVRAAGGAAATARRRCRGGRPARRPRTAPPAPRSPSRRAGPGSSPPPR